MIHEGWLPRIERLEALALKLAEIEELRLAMAQFRPGYADECRKELRTLARQVRAAATVTGTCSDGSDGGA